MKKLENIKIKWQLRKLPKSLNLKRVVGLDTETLEGKVKLISMVGEKQKYLFPKSKEDLLIFLTQKELERSVNFFYNLDFDVRAIFKFLFSKSELEELYYNHKLDFENYKFFYIPRKKLTIRKNTHTFSFYDLAQFFGFVSLDYASKKFLNKQKISYDVKNIDFNDFKVVEYCINDALLTKELGEFFINSFKQSGIDFYKPVSTAYISEKFFMSKCNIPTINYLDKKILDYALNCYRGGRFEAFQRGFFEKAYQYDIKSAYPYHISNLIDIRYGFWEHVKEFVSADYGFYKVFIKDENPYICLTNDFLRYELKNVNYYCQGEQTTFLTQNEIDFFSKKMYGKIKVIDGYVFHANEKIKPFEIIKTLYKKRSESVFTNYALKIVMNSLYGKFYQLQKKSDGFYHSGNLFNPIYASVITSNTRLQLLDFSMDEDTLLYMTDSVITTKKKSKIGDDLGEWSLDCEGETGIIGSGIYFIDNKNKFRGFKKNYSLKEEVLKNCDKKEIDFTFFSPQTIAQSLLHREKRKFEDLNNFVKFDKKLNVNFDKKRLWERNFTNFKDFMKNCVNSKPLKTMKL